MSFAGHVLDMIARDRYNRALRQSYRNRHSRMKEALATEASNHRLHDKKISKEEMQKIKQSIRMSIRRERRAAMVKTIVLTLLVAVILGFLFIRFAFGQVIESALGDIGKIEVFDMLGRKVIEKDHGNNNNRAALEIDRVAPGIYRCHIMTGHRMITRVIMKR